MKLYRDTIFINIENEFAQLDTKFTVLHEYSNQFQWKCFSKITISTYVQEIIENFSDYHHLNQIHDILPRFSTSKLLKIISDLFYLRFILLEPLRKMNSYILLGKFKILIYTFGIILDLKFQFTLYLISFHTLYLEIDILKYQFIINIDIITEQLQEQTLYLKILFESECDRISSRLFRYLLGIYFEYMVN